MTRELERGTGRRWPGPTQGTRGDPLRGSPHPAQNTERAREGEKEREREKDKSKKKGKREREREEEMQTWNTWVSDDMNDPWGNVCL